MKNYLPLVAAFILIATPVKAQGPTLSLVGSSPSFSKGNINTEILTQIIQQKQEEVKKKVFRNTVIEGFNNASFTGNLKNFTTYHYLYNVMDVLTNSKNKTAMTKSIIEHSTEFAYVFGLALYITEVNDQKIYGSITLNKSIFTNIEREIQDGKLKPSHDVATFNLIIDICYDVILNNDNLQKTFKFKDDLSDKSFKKWYESDNCFKLTSNAFNSIISNLKETNNLNILAKFKLIDKNVYNQLKTDNDKKNYLLSQQASLISLEDNIKVHLTNLNTMANGIQITIDNLKTLQSKISNEGVRKSVDDLLSSLAELPATTLKTEIEKINTEYIEDLTTEQKGKFTAIASAINTNYDQYRQLIGLYVGLKKFNYKDFTLSKDQYYAMKYVLVQFLNFAKNRFDNHVATSVIDFLIQNTIVEYMKQNSDNSVIEKNARLSDKGYLYIDVESIISAVDQYYNPSTRKSSIASSWWFINPRPFFSIGTNYGYFMNKNTLAKDDAGNPVNLQNLYFASEKIGFKIKFFDNKYSRSFKPGEKFYYKGTEQVWKRPQPIATVSDMHLIFYASGLLYNIIDIKSNENFNYAVVGSSLGITFFNGLNVNFGFACPFTDKRFNSDNIFLNVGFDIPIVEYIAALRKKN
ncbi:MAG: hypothetical protein MUC49_20955 [Raineya sp.]|jgi:hypothetical protein|nr:hypothetical protein [Raineya sp.]